jgi:hypothetical protein
VLKLRTLRQQRAGDSEAMRVVVWAGRRAVLQLLDIVRLRLLGRFCSQGLSTGFVFVTKEQKLDPCLLSSRTKSHRKSPLYL